jgi:streptomycin 3"-adenylyltransferase
MGVYLHGSAGFGHFVAGSSDLDLLIVANTSAGGDREFFDTVARLDRPHDMLGLEVSVLAPEDLRATGTQRSFRAHFALNEKEQRFVPGVGHPGDPDLVLHVAVCLAAGISLVGPPAAEVFLEPERQAVLQTLISELEWAAEDGDWTYAVLNAARAWRYAEENVMSSKLDGWLWIRPRIPQQRFLDQALIAYLTPRDCHRIPPIDLAGYESWAQALLRHTLEVLHESAVSG